MFHSKRLIFCMLFILLTLFFVQSCHILSPIQSNLDTLQTKANFLKILDHYGLLNSQAGFPKVTNGLETNDAAAPSSDYSKTNTQVSGVDEADTVKTDGEFIYAIAQGKVVIAKAYPARELSLEKTLSYENFYPSALYVDDDYLIVMGYSYSTQDYGYDSETSIYVYDKSSIETPVQIMTMDGFMNTTRKVDGHLLIVTNQYLYTNYINNASGKKIDSEINLPNYTINGEKHELGYGDIHYQENTYPSGFVTVYNFDLGDLQNTHYYSYLGSSGNVYVSLNNLYVAQYIYFWDKVTDTSNSDVVSSSVGQSNNQTLITKIPYSATGFGEVKNVTIDGFVQNQYSMDETNQTFRVATTNGFTWDNTSENNVYFYDEKLNLLSSLTDIAPGESIQSARFVGDRIYIVTYRQIDPFFVIDATNPVEPKLLGELKIPGYSTYLQPYDETHIIGFGFDTTTAGNQTRVSGIKISLFDVTDPTSPKELDKAVLSFGDMGYSYSEATYNPKALLFDKEKAIIGFPISMTSYEEKRDEQGNDTYNYYYKQFYMVYHVDLTGFTYESAITHFDKSELNQYQYGYEIMRGLYIDNNLYTVSQAKIQIHQLSNVAKIGELEIPFDENYYGYYWGYPLVDGAVK